MLAGRDAHPRAVGQRFKAADHDPLAFLQTLPDLYDLVVAETGHHLALGDFLSLDKLYEEVVKNPDQALPPVSPVAMPYERETVQVC